MNPPRQASQTNERARQNSTRRITLIHHCLASPSVRGERAMKFGPSSENPRGNQGKPASFMNFVETKHFPFPGKSPPFMIIPRDSGLSVAAARASGDTRRGIAGGGFSRAGRGIFRRGNFNPFLTMCHDSYSHTNLN